MARHAKCIKDITIEARGSKWGGTIRLGWQGDLDQVIGERDVKAVRNPEGKEIEPAKKVPVTLMDALGKYVTEENFEFLAASGRKTPAPAPQPQEL